MDSERDADLHGADGAYLFTVRMPADTVPLVVIWHERAFGLRLDGGYEEVPSHCPLSGYRRVQ